MTMISDRLLLERIRELKKAATPASLADAELLEELSSARAKLRVYREASGEPVAWMFHRAQIPRGTWWPWKLSFKQPPEYKGGFRIESVPLYASSQAVPEYPETLPCPVHLVPGLRLGKGCKTETLLIALQRRAEYYAGLDAMTPEERAKHDANIEAFKAMLPQPVPAASSESVSQSLTDALRDVIAERQRQVSVKGWTPEHDDTYTCGELSGAAISYIEPMEAVFYWPAEWHDDSFKPSDERRNLVKATALLLAEIERLDRISAASALSEVDRE